MLTQDAACFVEATAYGMTTKLAMKFATQPNGPKKGPMCKLVCLKLEGH